MTDGSAFPPVLKPADHIRLANTRAVALASLFLNYFASSVTLEQLNEISSSCGVSRAYAYSECVAALCSVGTTAEERRFTDRYLRNMFSEMHTDPFLSDPYYRTVKFPETSCGTFSMKMMELPACEAFVRDDFRIEEDGRMLPQLGFFTEPYPYPAVLENGREWMTLLPNETVTTLPAVKRAHGSVLTYGLGLGYFAFMASAKPDVSRVTVVEKSPDLIRLFNEHLLPQFPHRDKIEIVCADAFDYASRLRQDNRHFDYVFADIWHDVGDGKEMYLRLKRFEDRLPDAEYDYWLEKTILCYLAKDYWMQ